MPRKKEDNPVAAEEARPASVVDKPVDKSDKVEVSKADLDALFAKLDKQSQDIETLYKVADKNRLAREYDKNQGDLIRTFRIWRYRPNGRIVVGHQLISNVAELINGRYFEDQRTAVVFDDGTTLELSYSDFFRNLDKAESGEEVSRETLPSKDGESDEVIKLKLEDGQEIKINKKFLN